MTKTSADKTYCSECLIEIEVGEIFWTDENDEILCKDCLPKDAERIGKRH